MRQIRIRRELHERPDFSSSQLCAQLALRHALTRRAQSFPALSQQHLAITVVLRDVPRRAHLRNNLIGAFPTFRQFHHFDERERNVDVLKNHRCVVDRLTGRRVDVPIEKVAWRGRQTFLAVVLERML